MSSIKDMFTSRFEDGLLVQFDYSQLEVICLAWLSGDWALRQDIENGLDMHCLSASFAFPPTYEELYKGHKAGVATYSKMRKDAKPLGFLVQYGGAAGLMAHQTGLSKKVCQQFIDKYYERYSGVKQWQDDVAEDVLRNRRMSHHMVGTKAAGCSTISSVTGRRYTFVEQPSPIWTGKSMSFSPTQMKNFKVQGFATGDIVPMMLGRLNRMLKTQYPKVLLVNTTHDSVMIDVDLRNTNVTQLLWDVITLLESAPKVLKEVFDIDFDMELKVDAEAGPSWGTLRPWKKPSSLALEVAKKMGVDKTAEI